MNPGPPALILNGDARRLPLADASVDLVVTSPPYFALRDYQDSDGSLEGQIGAEETLDAYLDALVAATAEWVRVLKPTGSIFVNLGDKYAGGGGFAPNAPTNLRRAELGAGTDGNMRFTQRLAARQPGGRAKRLPVRHKSLCGMPWRYALRCIDELSLILRSEIIWHKPSGMPESVSDRVRRSHETVLHLTPERRYYASPALRTGALDGADRVPGSVWTIPIEPLNIDPDLGIDHYAAFPAELPRRIIEGWSPADGVVLDPFGGSGTTAAVARALGRSGIHNDLSADYCTLADWRCNGAGFAKTWAKVHAAPQLTADPSQLSLFAEAAMEE